MNVEMDFSVNKESKTISIKRKFNAELPLVWDAFTKPEILDQWWAPKPWKSRTKFMDFKEGGYRIYAMVGPAGEEHWSKTTFLSIQFQKRFSGLDSFSDSEGNVIKEMPTSKWDTRFSSVNNECVVDMILTFDDLTQLEGMIQMGFKEGLSMAMNGLDELLVLLKN